jgi:hypothetical protein
MRFALNKTAVLADGQNPCNLAVNQLLTIDFASEPRIETQSF